MNDQQFLSALEHGELPEQEFTHAAHVRAAYLVLRESDFPRALERIRSAIVNFATRLGKPEKYHETITVAFLSLIQQQRVQRGDPGSWAAFSRDNPELLRADLLLDYYDQRQLGSDLARRTFVLPRATARAAAAGP